MEGKKRVREEERNLGEANVLWFEGLEVRIKKGWWWGVE